MIIFGTTKNTNPNSCSVCGFSKTNGVHTDRSLLEYHTFVPFEFAQEKNMSIENRPNLNAAGMVVDIIKSLHDRVRGKAGKMEFGKIIILLQDDIQIFVERVDESLNQYFGK